MEKILEMENEDPSLKYPKAVRSYARSMVFLGLNDIPGAKKELHSLDNMVTHSGTAAPTQELVPPENQVPFINFFY